MHGRKPKVTEYGSPEFSQDRMRLTLSFSYNPIVIVAVLVVS